MPEMPEVNQSFIIAERAIDELRRQMGMVVYEQGGQSIANYPVEFLDEALLLALRANAMWLLITAARAKILGLADHDIRIDATSLTLADMKAICDPLALAQPQKKLSVVPASEIDSMALTLVKYAAVLPTLLLVKDPLPELAASWLTIEASDMKRYLDTAVTSVVQTASAHLPVEGAEKATLLSFRSQHTTSVHLALVIGDIDPETPPLTRIHSSCVTGDILGSLRCDCGDQLKLALSEICKEGSGILVYLHQEGRGIGITNKLRSYKLQEQGHDTFTANHMLGFEEDERDFSIAAAILKSLNVKSIRMLTNNPGKLSSIEKAGIKVASRLPLISPTSAHNHAYIEAKAKKAGHLF